MLLIAGLGNPGEKYAHTRHNVGFMFLDHILQNLNTPTPWKFDKYSKTENARTELGVNELKIPVLLAKPQTYMNRSGESIQALTKTASISKERIVIAHDDLDIEFGNFKIQLGVGPKKHNGLSSIQDHLHTPDFWRIRIGVDSRNGDRSLSGEDYVLQNFTGEEQIRLESIFKEIYTKFLTILS